MPKIALKIIAGFFGLALVVGGYSYFIEPNNFKIEPQIFKLDCLNSDIAAQKLVQISDLHFTGKTSEKTISKISEALKNINPFAVFITGDLIGNEEGIKPVVRLLKKISLKPPVFIVFGNWDYSSLNYNLSDFKQKLNDAGAMVLVNEGAQIEVGDELINLIGIDDSFVSPNVEGNLKKATQTIKDNDKNCKILLAHAPDVVKEAAKRGIDLVLAGHTHGGQVYIPFITEKMIPANPDGKGFVKGLYRRGKTQLYVNRGLGTSLFPFNLRFLVPPEITTITLKSN